MKKYILTGGPGSGKSSIILELEAQGEIVVREAAEDFIRLQQARGIAQPWLLEDFQDRILELQLQREKEIERTGRAGVFIDRGTLDGLAYYQILGKEPSEKMKLELRKHRTEKPYAKIFLIENLGACQTNQVRREDLAEALELERLQELNYRKHAGYGRDVIRIEPDSVNIRAAMVHDGAYWSL